MTSNKLNWVLKNNQWTATTPFGDYIVEFELDIKRNKVLKVHYRICVEEINGELDDNTGWRLHAFVEDAIKNNLSNELIEKKFSEVIEEEKTQCQDNYNNFLNTLVKLFYNK